MAPVQREPAQPVGLGQPPVARQPAPEPRPRDVFGTLKIVIAALGIVAAVLVWLPSLSVSDHASDITTVRLSKNLNDSSASGAPQQAVVAGWATVDYLELAATQLDESHAEQRRQSTLLFIGIATGGALVLVANLERRARRRGKNSEGQLRRGSSPASA